MVNQVNGKVYPSLGTCDNVKQESPILIDGEKTTWGEILEHQMSTWRVNYKGTNQFL